MTKEGYFLIKIETYATILRIQLMINRYFASKIILILSDNSRRVQDLVYNNSNIGVSRITFN